MAIFQAHASTANTPSARRTRGVSLAPRTWASRLPVSDTCVHTSAVAAVPMASTKPMGCTRADARRLPWAA